MFNWVAVGFGQGFFSRSFPLPFRECEGLRTCAIVLVVLILALQVLKICILYFVFEPALYFKSEVNEYRVNGFVDLWPA